MLCKYIPGFVREEVEGGIMESLPNIKYEDIEIKCEENCDASTFSSTKYEPVDCSSECTATSALNRVNVKEEINDICEDDASLWGIKCEDVEIKSEENYSDITSQNLKDEPIDCTRECQSEYVETTNHSMIKSKRERRGSKTEYRDLEHRDLSEEEIYRCNSCDYKTNRKKSLAKHQLRHTNGLEDMYICDSCSYKTADRAVFKSHQISHKNIPEEQMFKCDVCDFKTWFRKTLKRHQLKHKISSKEQMYKCHSCDYKTGVKSTLRKHQHRHRDIGEVQVYKCDLCKYRTGKKNKLTLHKLKHAHVFKCDSCDYEIDNKSKFTRHQLKHEKHKVKHENNRKEQMLRCNMCSYKSCDMISLLQHQLIHKYVLNEQIF